VKGAESYEVLFSAESGGPYEFVDKTDGTETTLSGLKSEKAYYFVVRAMSGDQESKNSEELTLAPG